MGTIHDVIDDTLEALIAAQPMFFVASAPLSASGHVNVSPKGLDTFRVLGPREVAYLDLIPLLDYRDDRTQLTAWTERKGDLSAYRRKRNRESIDGLPGVDE